jgi:hypothetical protein
LYDLTFLSEYLRLRPEDGPGWEHLLFSVVANAVISVSAYVSLVLFFRSRSILQKSAVTQKAETQPAGDAAPIDSPLRNGYATGASLDLDLGKGQVEPA